MITRPSVIVAAILGAFLSAGVHAPASSPQPPAPKPPPALDDLLGLPAPDRVEPSPVPDPAEAELQRQLSLSEAAEQFRQAVDLMGQAALRLDQGRDTGLTTQRLQDSAIRKLDMLIKAAEQQSQRRRTAAGSSSARQDQDPASQPSQPRAGARDEQSPGDNRSERMPPARREGPLGPEALARDAAWGALPPRLRDALLQGTQDRFSSLYQRLTEQYFRRLAEEPR